MAVVEVEEELEVELKLVLDVEREVLDCELLVELKDVEMELKLVEELVEL